MASDLNKTDAKYRIYICLSMNVQIFIDKKVDNKNNISGFQPIFKKSDIGENKIQNKEISNHS